ncbi:hypothetical protein N8T08_007032 [Aspergillus melleus]|uniref:Uncharacterized protein n=1 Tax=Aspergillus melleus TaxID=138277 RepID=A0ACC3AZB0_9EURO|nr:hypothetical protein N8T08_007032 [Aspergillus melleus]
MICLAYLSHLAKECGTWGLRREQFPLAQYSAQYWMGHAKIAESEENVQKMILSFFLQQKQAYATWIELFDPWAQIYGGEMATPLYFASLANLRYTLESLLWRGADVNAEGGRYGSALQAASYQGHKDVVQLLLQKGADVNAHCGKYGSALRAASSRGHEDVVQLLLEKGANAQIGRDNALHDHKTLLLLLEQRNKRALMMAREEAKLFEGRSEDR